MTGKRVVMSHVDDERLTAWLDGQLTPPDAQDVAGHVASCPACSARADEERSMRERSAELLRNAAPADLAPPPFDAIRQAAAGRPRTRRMPYRALAAAATIAVVAGVGWYARVLTVEEQPVVVAERARTAADAAPIAAPIDARTPPAAIASAAREQAGTGGGAADRAGEPPAAGARNLAQAAAEERADEGARVAAAPARARRAAIPGRQETEAGWRSVSPADAARLLGDSVRTIPGFPVLSQHVLATGPALTVRTLQVVDGVEVELLQEAVGVEPDAGPVSAELPDLLAARPDVQEAVVGGEAWRVTGRARLPLDSLRALLALLRR